MPTRDDALVVCLTCGVKWGSIRRFLACEDMEAVELALVGSYVPRMIRHWSLGHHVKVRDGAPLAVAAVIEKAAREMAAAENADQAPSRKPNARMLIAAEVVEDATDT